MWRWRLKWMMWRWINCCKKLIACLVASAMGPPFPHLSLQCKCNSASAIVQVQKCKCKSASASALCKYLLSFSLPRSAHLLPLLQGHPQRIAKELATNSYSRASMSATIIYHSLAITETGASNVISGSAVKTILCGHCLLLSFFNSLWMTL